jgi:DNA-binding response OmpR family regulator
MSAREQPAGRATHDKRRVLLVEDDEGLRRSLREVLESKGWACTAVSDGEEALQALGEQPIPDLVVLELLLPRFDGWNVINIVNGLATIPILAISGLDDEKTGRLSHGAAGLLLKPFGLGEFVTEVDRLCGAPRL